MLERKYAVFIGREDAPVLTNEQRQARVTAAIEAARMRDAQLEEEKRQPPQLSWSDLSVKKPSAYSTGELVAYEQMYEATVELWRQNATRLGRMTTELISEAEQVGPVPPTDALLAEVHDMQPYKRPSESEMANVA